MPPPPLGCAPQVMGSAEAVGNVTPVAEFNFHADPEAAQVVLRQVGAPPARLPVGPTELLRWQQPQVGRARWGRGHGRGKVEGNAVYYHMNNKR